MGCECHQIGGPFIAEDPDCEVHRSGGLNDQMDEIRDRLAQLKKENERLKKHETCDLGSDCPCYRMGLSDSDDRSDLYA